MGLRVAVGALGWGGGGGGGDWGVTEEQGAAPPGDRRPQEEAEEPPHPSPAASLLTPLTHRPQVGRREGEELEKKESGKGR